MAVARKTTRKKAVKRVTTRKRTPVKRTAAAKRKAAVIEAKTEAQRISHYLRALESRKRTKGPKRNPEVVERRIAALRSRVKESTGIQRLLGVQRLRNLNRELATVADEGSFETHEKNFIASAKSYGERVGIDYGAWREVGVDAAVLKKAGISRGK